VTTYSTHAEQRLVQRRISKAEAEAVLADPDTTYNDPTGKLIFIGHPNGRYIKVVVSPGSSPPHIITAMD